MTKTKQIISSLKILYANRAALDKQILKAEKELVKSASGIEKAEKPAKPTKPVLAKKPAKAKTVKKPDAPKPAAGKPKGRKPAAPQEK